LRFAQDLSPTFTLRLDAKLQNCEPQNIFESYASGRDVRLLQNSQVCADPGLKMQVWEGESRCLGRVPLEGNDLLRVLSFQGVIVGCRFDLSWATLTLSLDDAISKYGRNVEIVIPRQAHRLAFVWRK
jgi:hypothetical protein